MTETETGKRGIWSRVRTKKGMLVLCLSILLVTAGVAAATVITSFSQTIPSSTSPGQVATPCGSPLQQAGAPTLNSTDSGAEYAVSFDCTGGVASLVFSSSAMLKVDAPSAPVSVIAINLIPHLGTPAPLANGCGGVSGEIPLGLTNNNIVTVAAGSYDYCLDVTAGDSPGSFTITWSSS